MLQKKIARMFRIAVLPMEHMMVLNETSENNVSFVAGIDTDIVRILSNFMQFKYKLFVPKDREWGKLDENGEWTGLIGMVNRSEVDMGISFLSITEARQKVVDFIPYHAEATTIVANIPTRSSFDPLFYLHPFQNDVWIACLLALLTVSILYTGFPRKLSYGKILFDMFGYLASQPSNLKCQTRKQRCILGSWNIFSRLIIFGYTAVLLSFETTPRYNKGVETIEDLAEEIRGGNYKCYAAYGSSDHEFLLKSTDSSLQYIGQTMFDQSWLISGNALPNTLDENTAIVGQRSIFQLKKDASVMKNVRIFKENIAVWNAGIAVRKDFCCTQQILKIVNRIQSSGIYEKLYTEEVYRSHVLIHKNSQSKNKEISINIRNIHGTFFLLLGGLGISTVVFISELVAWFLRRRKCVRFR